MELLVQREPSTLNSTPGTLSIDGAFECFTLEDVVREVPGRPVSTWKIARPNCYSGWSLPGNHRLLRPLSAADATHPECVRV